MGGLPCHSGAGGGLTRLVTCRPCHHCPRRGACLLCRLPTLPLACFPAPYPPARARRALFPGGEGGDQGYFMQGAPPLASPAFNRLRHLQTFSNMNPAEGLPGWLPADLAAVVPGEGGLLFCRPPTLPLACFPAPYPPAPSPMGKGRFMVISCKGLRPLHPQHLTACGTYRPFQT